MRFLRVAPLQDTRQPFEVVSHRLERQFQLVFGQSQIPHPPVVLPLFQMGKDALNLSAHQTLLLIWLPVGGGELNVVRFLFQNPVADAAIAAKTSPSYWLAVLITAARIN